HDVHLITSEFHVLGGFGKRYHMTPTDRHENCSRLVPWDSAQRPHSWVSFLYGLGGRIADQVFAVGCDRDLHWNTEGAGFCLLKVLDESRGNETTSLELVFDAQANAMGGEPKTIYPGWPEPSVLLPKHVNQPRIGQHRQFLMVK